MHLHPQRLNVVGAVRAPREVLWGPGPGPGQEGTPQGVVRTRARPAAAVLGETTWPGSQCEGSRAPARSKAPPHPAPLTERLNWIWFHPLSRRMGMVQMNGFTRVVDCGSAGSGRGAAK